MIISVVLVKPRYAENVGAVARALENVGGGELILVSANRVTRDAIAARVARGGEKRLAEARCCDALEEALLGFDLTVATSWKTGWRRKPLTPWELSSEVLPALRPRSVALVMGREDHGLSNDELDLCHRLVTIPSQGPFNLAQATVILLYELLVRPPNGEGGGERAIPTADIPRITAAAESALRRVGYPHHRKPMRREMEKLANILARAKPNRWETNFLIGMFREVERWATGR